MSQPTLPKRKYKEIWQGLLILGTLWLAFGIVYTINPSEADPYLNIILFSCMIGAYIISFIAFRKYQESGIDRQSRQGVEQ